MAARKAPKRVRASIVETLANDIIDQLECLKADYANPKNPAHRREVLDLLRRARALVLLGDIGTDGKVSALENLLRLAAEDVRGGEAVSRTTQRAVRQLKRHRMLVRGAGSPYLHDALLQSTAAMARLETAVREWASGGRGSEKLARWALGEAALAVGLQTKRDKQRGKTKKRNGGATHRGVGPRQSGFEPREAANVRMAVARAKRAAADPS